ncbi:L,D-transpeptidase, partial [Bradyrhizobium sp. Arg62]|nr:L,D-transpeptidase [Bradyrhizobium brasilense]
MMINRILTICAAAALGVAGTSLAHAQQGYPAPQGTAYSTAPQPYPQGSMPDFDALNDDDGQDSAALPPPGPVLSPNDPRYGRPANAPAYSDRGAPTGPVMSP